MKHSYRSVARLLCGLLATACAGTVFAAGGSEPIVRAATGTGRAVYAPLDRPVILPRFIGEWALLPSRCPAGRGTGLILQQRSAWVGGHLLTVDRALVMAGEQQAGVSDRTLSPAAFAGTRDLLLGFRQTQSEDPRFIHFYLSTDGRLLVAEEVGEPRRTYTRCTAKGRKPAR